MLYITIIVFGVISTIVSSQVTNVIPRSVLLSRKKRYLAFPMNSNFVVNLSLVKAVMEVQPRGFMYLGECDVPFALPTDTRLLKKRRNHFIQRREVLNNLEVSLSQYGFDGIECVKRMICEANKYITNDKSLVKDMLLTIFNSTDMASELKYTDYCHSTVFSKCAVPFMSYILGSLSSS